MIDPAPLLTQPAPDAARALALSFLARVASAREQLRLDVRNVEAVHDARVAITRLRATLRVYHEVLDGSFGKRGRRALRRMNRALGTIRDLDVQRSWLTQHVETMPELAGEGARHVLSALERKRDKRAQHIDALLTRHFDSAHESWQHRLRHYRERRVVGEPVHIEPLAAVLVQQLHHTLHRFEQAVHDAAEHPDSERLHAARIAIKRLRALLVPWLDEVPNVRALYDVLSAAQDALGNTRDAQLLTERARRSAERAGEYEIPVAALADFCDDQREQLASALSGAWLADVHASAMLLVPDTTHALSAIARADHEIERKFLLSAAPPLATQAAGVRIAQGWLPGEKLRERLRRSVHTDGRVEWTRTVKVGTGVARIEVEESTEPLLFESLWPLTASARVEKVRYAVADGAFIWEIDVFLDRDLVLAEVELPSADTLVSFPDWLAPFVVRDVTGDAAYVNANLARDRRIHATTA
jgi:CHAD domain-containing protein/CYTH domain-containing protein